MDDERARKVAAVIFIIARGDLTPDGLAHAVEDGRAQVKRLGQRIEQTALDALDAGEEALALIERERSKLAQIDL